jgi:hypothetical protein
VMPKRDQRRPRYHPICHSCDRISAPMRQDDATRVTTSKPSELIALLAMSVSLALTCQRLPGRPDVAFHRVPT